MRVGVGGDTRGVAVLEGKFMRIYGSRSAVPDIRSIR